MDGIGRRSARGLRALVLAVIAGAGLAVAAAPVTAAASGSTPTEPGRVCVPGHVLGAGVAAVHRHAPSTPAESAENAASAVNRSPEERSGSHGGPGAPLTGPIRSAPPGHAAPAAETEHDRALARAGRPASWPTGPPVLSL